MSDKPPPPIQARTFAFGDHQLTVDCRKTLAQTINFRLTVQCEVDEIFESLRGYGGGYAFSSDEEEKEAPGASEQQGEQDEGLEQPSAGKPDLLGLDIWPAALELCVYIAVHPHLVFGHKVVELGAGVGLPGLLAAQLGATAVCLTDYEPRVMVHVANNAATNGVADQVSGLVLDWTKLGELPFEHRNAYTLVLAADVLYIESIMQGFVDAMILLLMPDGMAIIGHQTRRALVLDETGTPEVVDEDVAFGKFRALCEAAGFTIKVLGSRESPGFPGPLLMLGLAKEEATLQELPPAFTTAVDSGGEYSTG